MKDTSIAESGSGVQTRGAEELETVRIWDPLLRLFHWALAICVTAAWGLGEFGPDVMTLHFWFGYAVLGLLGFRLLWGFVGPEHARFRHFFYGPLSIFRYLRGMFSRGPSYWPGHNPVGGVFVFVLLAVIGAQAATGLFSDPEDYINVGPLAGYVSSDNARSALSLHATLGWAVAGLVALHLAAIAFYARWKGENLVRPMITGRKIVRKEP